MPLTPGEERRLAAAETAFEEAGGRGVELAEEIDALRQKRDAPDLAEFISDYCEMLRGSGERVPPRKKLAKEIAEAYKDYGGDVTPAQVEYYLA